MGDRIKGSGPWQLSELYMYITLLANRPYLDGVNWDIYEHMGTAEGASRGPVNSLFILIPFSGL